MSFSAQILHQIQTFAAERGLLAGICPPERLIYTEAALTRRQAPFTAADAALRVDPLRTMPQARSVIVLGMGYARQTSAAPIGADDTLRGQISMGACGRDYHVTLRETLEALMHTLYELYPPLAYQIYADTGPLAERELAVRAGLGFVGRHGSVISRGLGSLFFIGYALTNMPLWEDMPEGRIAIPASYDFCDPSPQVNRLVLKPAFDGFLSKFFVRQGNAAAAYSKIICKAALTKHGEKFRQKDGGMRLQDSSNATASRYALPEPGAGCGSCERCLQACPTGALGREGTFHTEKCISYLTQKKGALTPLEMDSMGRQIYGCDLCQTTCPYNQGIQAEAVTDMNALQPDLDWFLHLTKARFQKEYGHTAAAWRGFTVLKRNAVIALGNTGDARALPLLKEQSGSEKESIRQAAAYGILKLTR